MITKFFKKKKHLWKLRTSNCWTREAAVLLNDESILPPFVFLFHTYNRLVVLYSHQTSGYHSIQVLNKEWHKQSICIYVLMWPNALGNIKWKTYKVITVWKKKIITYQVESFKGLVLIYLHFRPLLDNAESTETPAV